MFERYFPNLYGWLAWGGGFSVIRKIARINLILWIIGIIFWFGRLSTGWF